MPMRWLVPQGDLVANYEDKDRCQHFHVTKGRCVFAKGHEGEHGWENPDAPEDFSWNWGPGDLPRSKY